MAASGVYVSFVRGEPDVWLLGNKHAIGFGSRARILDVAEHATISLLCASAKIQAMLR